jgi:hypothetical protein
MLLRGYGLLPINGAGDCENALFRMVHLGDQTASLASDSRFTIYFLDDADAGSTLGLDCKIQPGQRFVYSTTRRFWMNWLTPRYYCLLPHISFTGRGNVPIWRDAEGRAVLAWLERGSRRDLVVGMSVVEELIRYTHGDPEQTRRDVNRSAWGYGHERPVYLYDHNLAPGKDTTPWADHLGLSLVELIAQMTGIPLIEPLPGGCRGAVLLTGDDDQAYLEKYAEQIALIGDFPMTYLLLPHTRHSRQTLEQMPRHIELGLHVDALPDPENYRPICAVQCEQVRAMTDRPVHAVRNHGHLSQGYWGHLPAWEDCDLTLDLNVPGMDGTIRTGSLLPFRVRRADGSWSSHYSLFSGFSDSMHFHLRWSERKQSRRIRTLARSVESGWPGVLVFNYHPQNVSSVTNVHRAIMAQGRSPGWTALGAQSYLRWLQARDLLTLDYQDRKWALLAHGLMDRLAIRIPSKSGWEMQVLGPWHGKLALANTGITKRD